MNCIALRMLDTIGDETDSISMLPMSGYAWTEQ